MGGRGGSQREVRIASWRDLLQQRADSGLSVRAFCTTRGISEQRFYYWQRVIAKLGSGESVVSAVTSEAAVTGSGGAGSPPRLMPIQLVARPGWSNVHGSTIEVEWPRGLIVRTSDQVNPESLARVLRAVDAIQSGDRLC